MTSLTSFRTPGLTARFPELIAAESTRHGGVSPAPFHSLNLGLNTADDPYRVETNRNIFFEQLGVSPGQVASSHQVHGDQILPVTQPGRFDGYDALITNQPGVFLTVTVADCTPVLLFDPVRKAVAAIHAGWRGTVAEIAGKALRAMQDQFGSDPAACHAYIGTCIDECSFEVGADVAGEFAEAYRRFDPQTTRYYVDLKAANRAQLLAEGIKDEHIEVSPYSTVLHNADYFSYRLEKGQTGRMIAMIGLKKQTF